tara:strand:+ start:235 stop:576 length:342 start_codon:yes stop_codon:yes gene_type:complete
MNSKHIKGNRAELIAAEHFLDLGYSVHRNMSSHGLIDMVLVDEEGMGEPILIDVKALSLRSKNGWKVNRVPTKRQQELGVELVFVNLDTKEVYDNFPSKSKVDMTNIVEFKKC